jgi:hypothetical protein
VIVEHGGGGSKAAAPIARDVMLLAALRRRAAARGLPPGEREEIERVARGAPCARRRPGRREAARVNPFSYGRARGMSMGEKLVRMNWPLLLLTVAVAGVGFMMLYSVAGGDATPGRRAR